ncbi:MAG: hypothetical protein KAI18_00015 [Candidatus Aenigmarchaeota archaeon]|nr:hypothetical protein [Candidatus Aenigmarchaeota archaeon]
MVSSTKNRKGNSAVINTILVLVMLLVVAAILISFISGPAKKLDIFTTEKNDETSTTLDVGTLALMDTNFVNFDTTKAKTEMIKLINISSTSSIIDCGATTLTSEQENYCTNITVSISPAPPKYSTTPEGIRFKISYINKTLFDDIEGYVNLTFVDVYEFNQVFTSKLGDFNNCTDPITESCFNESTTKPMTNLTLISMFNDEIFVRMPFYYDNLVSSGFSYEDNCVAYANYSNLTAQNTNIQIEVDAESPAPSYNFTIVHMEKSHKREYPIYCNVSINRGIAHDFPVQVVSGDYDLFRIYGWNSTSTDCIMVKDDVLVKKDDTTPLKIKFKC